MYDPFASFKKTVLDNGLTVYVSEQPRPFVSVDYIVHAGAREEPRGKEGLFHFLEHMVSSNIPDYPNVQRNSRFFQNTGGSVNFGTTGYLATFYGFVLPIETKTLRIGFDIFSKMLVKAKIYRHAEKEREIILQELWRHHTNPQCLELTLRAPRILLGDHRQSRAGWLGLPDEIKAFSYADLQSAYDRYYVPANISIVCVGGMNSKDLIKALEGTPLGRMSSGKRNPSVRIRKPTNILSPSDSAIEVSAKEIGRGSKLLNYEAYWVLPSSLKLEAIRTVRRALEELLFEEIREKSQLTYDIDVSETDYRDHHTFSIGSDLDPKAEKMIDKKVRSVIASLPKNRKKLWEKVGRKIKQFDFVDMNMEELCEYARDDIIDFDEIVTAKMSIGSLRDLRWKDFEDVIELLIGKSGVTKIVTP